MLLERNQVGKREMLANFIARVDAKNTPVQSMMPKGGNITNMLSEWQVDDFEEPEELAVEDGLDVETFDNASPNRQLVQGYAMKIRDSAMVSDLAEEVSDVAGLSKGELAESIMKKLTKVGRVIEAYICGDQEMQAGAAGVAYKSRALGKWIQNGAQTVNPVHASYRTPSGSINTTATASLTQDHVNDVLQSSYEQTGERGQFDMPCGPTLKRRFSKFTQVDSGAANTFSVVRTYNTQFNGKIDNVVTQFEGDFGHINLHPTLWNAHKAVGFGGDGANTTIGKCRGYLLLMKLLMLKYKRKPRVKQLEDRGGGPRFLVDAILLWEVKNPLGLGKFAATT